MTKICSKCGDEKGAEHFHTRYDKAREAVGLYSWCKACSVIGRREWGRKNPAKAYAISRRWQLANPEHAARIMRKATLNQEYDMTPDEHARMEREQGGVCAICGRPPTGGLRTKRLFVDHDHTTGAVRGLLCTACNNALGQFQDSQEILDKAKAYLQKHAPQVTLDK